MKLNFNKRVPVISDTNLGPAKRLWRDHLMAGVFAVCSVGGILSIVEVQATDVCVINLNDNTHTCDSVSAITFISQPTNNQAVVKITLDPSSGYTKVIFDVTYDAEPTGWTVDICDSQSCNGWGGDAGHTSNAAEVEVLGTSFNAYRNTLYDASEPMLLLNKPVSINQGTTISLEVSDEYLGWNFPNEIGKLCSDRLFTLNGQIPTYGTVDYDIYAAFNRVIDNTSRNGSGASSVSITVSTEPTVGENCEVCEEHATYSVENGLLYIPFVDMPTVSMIGTPSQKKVMMEASLQLIQASNLFEIEEIKLLPPTITEPSHCHATYSLDGKLHIPFVNVPLVTILNGIPIPLGVETYDVTLQSLPFSGLFTIENVVPVDVPDNL